MADLKSVTMAEMEKEVMKNAAIERLKMFKDTFVGLDHLDAGFVDSTIPQLAGPMRKTYCGLLYEEVDKSFVKGLVNSSAKISEIVAESKNLRTIFFSGNPDGVLTSYCKQDLERIQSIFAGITDPDKELVSSLIEQRANVMHKEYEKTLRDQLPKVFGQKQAVPINKPAGTPATFQKDQTDSGKTQAAATANQ